MSGTITAAADLRRLVRGPVSTDARELDRRSIDYGRLLRRRAAILVQPADTGDVAAVVRYAFQNGLEVTAQGTAHSQGGQSLSQGGILLDMRGFGRVEELDEARRSVCVGAGVAWREVAAASLRHGLIPPVLTDNLRTTVGGTASVGGIGFSSFRYGTQLDHHVALEIVAGTGDVVRCSADQSSDLFLHALGGLGQFGVITRAWHDLRRPELGVQRTLAGYAELHVLLDDVERLMAEDAADYLSAYAVPSRGHWSFVLVTAIETDGQAAHRHASLLAGLRCRGRPVSLPVEAYGDFVLGRAPRGFTPWERDPMVAAAGVDVILPRAKAVALISEVVSWLPRPGWSGSKCLILFLRSERLTRPMFVTPDASSLVVLTMAPVVPAADAAELRALLERCDHRARELGGTRYLPGWLNYSGEEWRAHFGSRWPDVERAKREYDPRRVLRSSGLRF